MSLGGIEDAARFLTRERFDLVFVGHGRVDEPCHVVADLVTSEAIKLPGQGCCDGPSNPPRTGGAFVVSRSGDRGGLLPPQHDDTDYWLLIGEYSRGLPYDLMTFEERDQVDAERTDAIRETVSSLPERPGTRR
ncbi:hypothetical protein [Actinoallomurus acanthiterrae]